MEFDWTTSLLEVINFLVLMWILQRFLYKPVGEAVARRRAVIEQTQLETRTLRAEAESLQRQYEGRMAAWTEETSRARSQMLQEIAGERQRLLAELQVSLEEERSKQHALEERRASELRLALQNDARLEGSRFAARLLSRLASPSLARRILDVLLEDLGQLADPDLTALRAAAEDGASTADISTSHELDPEQRDSLARALAEVMQKTVDCDFRLDPALIAGCRIGIGPWMLRSNILDELQLFAEAQNAAH